MISTEANWKMAHHLIIEYFPQIKLKYEFHRQLLSEVGVEWIYLTPSHLFLNRDPCSMLHDLCHSLSICLDSCNHVHVSTFTFSPFFFFFFFFFHACFLRQLSLFMQDNNTVHEFDRYFI